MVAHHSIRCLDLMSPRRRLEIVASAADPLLRNELITHNYWRIADRFYRRFGKDNLVWPTFGSWASAQAGEYMRLGVALPLRVATVDRARRVTKLLARGNQLIFEDIGPPFWRFLDLLESRTDRELDDLRHSPGLHGTLATLLDLDPRSFDESPDGEHLMVLAFEQYLRALAEPSADARAERVFVANACVGLQEQTRVDRILDDLLDIASVNRPTQVALRTLWPGTVALTRAVAGGWAVVAPITGTYGKLLERKARNYRRLARAILFEGRVTQVIGTQIFMELDLGEDHFDISDDIVGCPFATGLEEITLGDRDFRSTFELVRGWDRTPDSTAETGAVDWTDLSDRMNFIIDLFRARQADRRLTRHPLDR